MVVQVRWETERPLSSCETEHAGGCNPVTLVSSKDTMLHFFPILLLVTFVFFVSKPYGSDATDHDDMFTRGDDLVQYIPPDLLKSLMTIFVDLADLNKDKKLSVDELQNWFQHVTSASKKRLLEEELDDLDSDSDNVVTLLEYQEYVALKYPVVPPLPSVVQERFDRYDTDKDGKMSLKEAEALVWDPPRSESELLAQAEVLVKEYGKSENSTLSLEEFTTLHQKLAKEDPDFSASVPEAKDLFEKADVDGNERVTADELAGILMEDMLDRHGVSDDPPEEVAEHFVMDMKEELKVLADTEEISFAQIFEDLQNFSRTAFTHGGELFSTIDEMQWVASLFDDTAAASIGELFADSEAKSSTPDDTGASTTPKPATEPVDFDGHDEL